MKCCVHSHGTRPPVDVVDAAGAAVIAGVRSEQRPVEGDGQKLLSAVLVGKTGVSFIWHALPGVARLFIERQPGEIGSRRPNEAKFVEPANGVQISS